MKKYSFSVGMLIFALMSGAVGLFLGLSVAFKWFGNFGALIVLFGVASEYFLVQLEFKTLYNALKGQGSTSCGNTGIPDLTPQKSHKILAIISHITIVLGTLIWGFGEWYISWVLNA